MWVVTTEVSPAIRMWLASAVFALFLGGGVSLLYKGNGGAPTMVAIAAFVSAFMVPAIVGLGRDRDDGH